MTVKEESLRTQLALSERKIETETIELDVNDICFLENQIEDSIKKLRKKQKEEIALRGFPNKHIEYEIKSWNKIFAQLEKTWL